MRKRNIILLTLVLALVICATIQPTIAYFTTYVTAKGGYEVSAGDTTKISEKIVGQQKQVTIHSEEGSVPVYIRAKVLYTGPYDNTIKGDNWTNVPDDNGYYYYIPILNAGKDTDPLVVTMGAMLQSDDPNLKVGDSFSVVVVYESTPVRYRTISPDVVEPYADWDAQILDAGTSSSEG